MRLPAMSRRAARRARKTFLRIRFMFERSFRLEVIQATWLAHTVDVLSGGEQEARRDFSGAFPQRDCANDEREREGSQERIGAEGRGERS